MNLASGRQRAMLFVDGSNFLIELFSQLGVEKRAVDRSPVHAINLAHQVIHPSVYQNFLFLVLGAGRIWGSFASTRFGKKGASAVGSTSRCNCFGMRGALAPAAASVLATRIPDHVSGIFVAERPALYGS